MNYRERIVEVLAKYNVRLDGAPLDALAMAMERMGSNRSLLRPASKCSPAPDITTPEGAKQASDNARYYRDTLKPFA